jgi:hypothetical protein
MPIKEIKTVKEIILFLIITALMITSCDATEPNSTRLSLSIASDSELLKSEGEEFQISEVKLLIRDIKIKNQAQDNELQVKTGPIAVNLDLEGNITEFASSEIPEGAYDRVRFSIHKIEDSEECPDPEFKEGTENTERFSVIVKGMLNGEEFRYRSRKSAEQDVKLTEDIIIAENEDANLTIIVDPYSWFYEGETFLNPNISANDDKIDNNLKTAFKRAFKDNDHDGLDN